MNLMEQHQTYLNLATSMAESLQHFLLLNTNQPKMKQENPLLLPSSLEFSAKRNVKGWTLFFLCFHHGNGGGQSHTSFLFFFLFLILLTLIFYCPCSLFYYSLHNALPQHVYDMFLAITFCPPMLMAGHYILGGKLTCKPTISQHALLGLFTFA